MGLPDMRVGWQVEMSPIRASTASRSISSFERYAFKRDDGTIVVRRIADDRTLLELPGLPRRSHGADRRVQPRRPLSGDEVLERSRFARGLGPEARRAVLTEANFSGHRNATWAFHPDGRRLAFGRRMARSSSSILPDGRELQRWTNGFGGATSMAFNPDGSRLAFVSASVVRCTSWRPIPAGRSLSSTTPRAGLSPRLEPASAEPPGGRRSRTTRSGSGTWTQAARRSRSREIATTAWWSRFIPVATCSPAAAGTGCCGSGTSARGGSS